MDAKIDGIWYEEVPLQVEKGAADVLCTGCAGFSSPELCRQMPAHSCTVRDTIWVVKEDQEGAVLQDNSEVPK